MGVVVILATFPRHQKLPGLRFFFSPPPSLQSIRSLPLQCSARVSLHFLINTSTLWGGQMRQPTNAPPHPPIPRTPPHTPGTALNLIKQL